MLTWQSPAVTLPIRGVLTTRKSDVFEAYAAAGWDLMPAKSLITSRVPCFFFSATPTFTEKFPLIECLKVLKRQDVVFKEAVR